MECLKAGLLCNDSLLLEKEGRWAIQGDPTEGALLVSAVKAGLDMTTARNSIASHRCNPVRVTAPVYGHPA